MSTPRVAARRSAAAAAICLALASGFAPPRASAQETIAGARINLVGQPVWHGPNDDLDLVVRVVNRSSVALEGFRLQVRAYPPVLTRSDLQLNLDVPPTTLESSSLPRIVEDSVPPGARRVVRINDSIESLASIATATEPGVYPLTITLTELDGGLALDSVTTFLLYFPTEVEVPLQIAPVWTIAELPARGPDGTFRPHPITGEWHLEAATGTRGWLTTTLQALQTRAGSRLRLGVATSPRTVEELDGMADGFTRAPGTENDTPTAAAARAARATLDGLRALIASARAQPLLAPYAFPDLPSIADDLERVQAQLANAEAVHVDVLERDPGRAWIFPPAGRVDRDTLDDLRTLGAGASTFIRADALEPPDPADPGCPAAFEGATYTCPSLTETTSGRTRAYVLDATLQERLADLTATGGRVALQRVFAELAMIWDELPGTADRIVPVVLPAAWNPPPRDARLMVRTLARAPWLVSRTPREGFHQGIGAATRSIVAELQPNALADASYEAIVRAARDRLESFSAIGPQPSILTRLERDLLVAHNRAWATDDSLIDEGLAYARGVEATIDDTFEQIYMGGELDITLTSRAGEVPLILFNDTGYDVTVEIDFDWADLDLDITPERLERTFPPGASPLPVSAAARGSGIGRVVATVSTPDGAQIERRVISIRSTEFNDIALAITLGAFSFLVLFYTFRGFRRRASASS